MTYREGADRRGIEIPAELAASERIPDDLDANAMVDYTIPNTARRRRASYVYLVAAVVGTAAAVAGVSVGFWFFVALSTAISAYHFFAGRDLRVKEKEALDVANRRALFTVGHASAVVGFEGLFARPVWNVLLFSADDPPTERALIRVDGSTGEVVDSYQEAISDTE